MANIDRLAYNRAGQLFMAANVSAKTMSTSSTTATGVILYNPSGSNKTLYVVDWGFAWTTVPGAIHKLGLGQAAPSTVVPSSVTAIGSGVRTGQGWGNAAGSVAQAYDAATIAVAPTFIRISFGAAWITGGSGEAPYSFIDYVDGAIAVPAGGLIQIMSETTAAVGVGSISWIEI